MKIYLVDRQRYLRVTYEEAKNILKSGLTPDQWTLANIQWYLLY